MKRRGGLGRGLDSLLPNASSEPESRSALRMAPVETVIPNPRQPRTHFDEEAVKELSASIAELGVLQPLLVRDLGGDRLELIAGERRLRAARDAGLTEVPVLIVDTDETGSLERALVENIHRTDLDPIEEAAAYKQLLDEGGLTQEQLGTKLGRSRVTIANALRLLDLPDAIKKLVINGRLTAGHARALLSLAGNPFQERLARRVADESLSVRMTEELVRRYAELTPPNPDAPEGTRISPPPSAVAAEAQRKLQDHLQTRVRITRSQRKGKISIDFASDDELERLVAIIEGEERGGKASTVSPT